MLLLRLATSKQAPDAPTLISSSSSSPADVKPKIVKAQSQTTPLSSQTQATPSPGAGLAGADNGGGGGLQPPAECGVGTSCGNIAAARLLDLGKKLIEATRAGRVEQVRHLVESSGAPFTSDSLGTTALHVAAQYGYADIAEILVRGGINRDARTKLERTALHLAAQSGSLDIVDLLVSHGSDVNARDMLRMTPLHWAVERGHVVVAERLLIAGADAESSNKFLLSPLDIARESGSSQMIELFKNWTGDQRDGQSLAAAFSKSSSAFAADANGSAGAPNDLLDFDYRLAFVDGAANSRNNSLLDNEESCIDLVGLEWNKCEFDPSFLLSGENDDEPKVEYLMKVVEELQKENQQLRQKVDQLSTVEP